MQSTSRPTRTLILLSCPEAEGFMIAWALAPARRPTGWSEKPAWTARWFVDGCDALASPTDAWAGQQWFGTTPVSTGTMAEAALLGEVCGPQSCLRSMGHCMRNLGRRQLAREEESPSAWRVYRKTAHLERVSYAACSVRVFIKAQGDSCSAT